ncbi:DUF3592 domain-containing protein [Aestuariirhabdus sp. Z084]|uniref:DUF3592 domain-containing protein n=1 Tax=Aestuariirhabdus haliotis TaxID=2918751 RepID=UPI00201B4086|nr:DUF3592 domain-containing protein [Aestuariirhabdus haliotis]MCL6415726.1 DUF3592 domain-containing protein [Aestuariirhabdus haliotis]MCL6419748.1 DUF3592 domain-containing protein [Aestuariirhabdus haliotis]
MPNGLMSIATGRSIYSTYFLIVFMIVAPAAVFTPYQWLDAIAWFLLIVLGVFILITGLITWQDAARSVRWPKIEAKLLGCSLEWRTSKGSKRYTPNIRCQFTINGKTYSGTEYDFSASATDKKKSQAIIDNIQSSTSVAIYYKPSDPSVNVIHPGTHLVHYLRIIIGSGAVIVAALSWAGIISY